MRETWHSISFLLLNRWKKEMRKEEWNHGGEFSSFLDILQLHFLWPFSLLLKLPVVMILFSSTPPSFSSGGYLYVCTFAKWEFRGLIVLLLVIFEIERRTREVSFFYYFILYILSTVVVKKQQQQNKKRKSIENAAGDQRGRLFLYFLCFGCRRNF